MNSNNIISFGSHRDGGLAIQTPQHHEINACRQILKESLPECFSFFNSLDDSLFKLADKAETNQLQDEFFVIMRQFRIKQAEIKQQFTKLTLSDFDKFWHKPTIKANTQNNAVQSLNNDAELSLMQNDALEKDIALKQIATKGDIILAKQLNQLDRRFAHILDSDQLFNNPLSPDHIATNLKKVISPITSNMAALLVTYKQFEQYVLPNIDAMYEKINDELVEYGILAKLSFKPRKSQNNTASSSLEMNNQNEVSSADTLSELEEDAVLFDDLRQLINGLGENTQYAHTHSGPPATLDTIMSALSGLQTQLNTPIAYDENGDVIMTNLRHSLLSNLQQTQLDGTVTSQSLSKIDEDTMNVISLLFEFVLEDRSIPAPIRALLARLQLPMLKVALTDKTFFSKKNHAARILLNNLARASTGWDHSNGQDDVLFSQVEDIVSSILTDFETDMQIFTDLNQQFHQFVTQQEKSSHFAEQRITKATEGQEKIQLAQQEADAIVNQLMTQYSPVPKTVIALIENNWSQILRLRYLQKGKDSPEWEQAVSLMEALLWSVAPKKDPADRKKLLATIPQLLKSLRGALSGPSFNQHKITSSFKDLQQCHIKCLNGDKLDESELQQINIQQDVSNKNPLSAESLVAIEEEKKVLSDQKALDAAKKLKVGTWLEINQNGSVQRVKFSWRSNLTGRCLFVSYQGLKVAELALSELAAWFQQGQVVIINQTSEPLMDRALVSMKQTIAKQATKDESTFA